MRDNLEFRRRIDDLKASISLKSLIERDGHKLVKNGSLWKLCCPFHLEKSPSCVIYPDNHFYCFGCATSGDVFGYMMKRDGCDFKAAVEKLDGGRSASSYRAPQRVIQRPKEPELPSGYFEQMWAQWAKYTGTLQLNSIAHDLGITTPILAIVGAAWSPENGAWAFPMFDHEENFVGIRLRDLKGKKWAVKGSKQGLFIPNFPKQSDLYVTEGPTDCAAMLSMGLFAIGKASAMQGPEEIVKFIQKHRIRRVIVIADNDTAGLNGAKKLIQACPVPCCELVLPAKDAREFYRNGGTRELIEALLKSAVWRHPKNANVEHK